MCDELPRSPRSADQRGSALVLAVFVLVLLAGMGVALLFMTQNEMEMSQANLRTKKSFYMAEAGLEDARMTLLETADAAGTMFVDFDQMLTAAAGVDTNLSFDPNNFQAVYDASDNVTSFTGYNDDVPVRPLTSLGTSEAGTGWYAAFLTNDPADSGGVLSEVDTNGRAMITAIGTASDRALEMVQAIIEPVVLMPPLPTAAISLIGPTPTFNGGSSNATDYSGVDCQGVGGTPGLYVPTVGTVGSDALDTVITDFSGNADYNSGSGNTGTGSFADLNDTGDPLNNGVAIDSVWTNCQELHDLVETLREEADFICVSGDCAATMPPTDSGSIIFFEGSNISLGPGNIGSGLFVATGSVVFLGSAEFEGMLMVIGEGQMQRSGAGSGYISGGTIVADIAGPDNIYGNADDCTGGPLNDGFGICEYDVSGGGNGTVYYCSDALENLGGLRTFRIVEFLQR